MPKAFPMLKANVEDAGLVLYNVGNMDVEKSSEIHLALERRDRRIEQFQKLIEILGSLDIGYMRALYQRAIEEVAQ
jgi:D-mannonate dehydratase